MSAEHLGDRAVVYLSGELPDAERLLVERHLDECATCRAEVDEVRLALTGVASWRQHPALPEGLEDRLVRGAVRQVGVATLGSTQRSWWRSGLAAGLLIGVLSGLAGFGAGRLTGRSRVAGPAPAVASDSTLRSYMLLLEEPRWPPSQPLTRDGYGAWAQAIRAESRYVGAEKFTEEPGFRVSPTGVASRPGAAEPNFSGWYIVRARSYDEAIAWARRGPHLAYGTVLVRQIE